MRFSGSIEDKLAIQELYQLYADTSTRNLHDEWLSCWTDDGEWHSHIFDCSGKVEIGAKCREIQGMFTDLAFMSQTGPVTVTGDTATAHSTAREIGRLKDGTVFKLVGAYEDHLRKVGGQWYFARRDYRPIVQEEPS